MMKLLGRNRRRGRRVPPEHGGPDGDGINLFILSSERRTSKLSEIVRALGVLVVYPLIHVPLLALGLAPVIVAVLERWDPAAAIGLCVLWSIPMIFVMARVDRSPWWTRLKRDILDWAR